MKINAAIITMLIILAIVLFVAPFLIYGYYFYDLEISKVNANWGNFGSFLSGVFSFFTALFTLISVVVLIRTFRKTITFNQQQIKIAQNESELNNFNFIINLIHKNIKEEPTLTIKTGTNSGFTYEKNHSKFTESRFAYITDLAIKKAENEVPHRYYNELVIKMTDDDSLENNINTYAKEYAYNNDQYKFLKNIYPLIESLCIKITDAKDEKQKDILRNILISAIDDDVLFWSLAVINNDKFDSFMILPYSLQRLFGNVKSVSKMSQ